MPQNLLNDNAEPPMLDFSNLKIEYSECQLRVMKYQQGRKQEDVEMLLKRLTTGATKFSYEGRRYRLGIGRVEKFKDYGCPLCSVFLMSALNSQEEEIKYQVDGVSFRSCIGMMLEQVIFTRYFFENLNDICWEEQL